MAGIMSVIALLRKCRWVMVSMHKSYSCRVPLGPDDGGAPAEAPANLLANMLRAADWSRYVN